MIVTENKFLSLMKRYRELQKAPKGSRISDNMIFYQELYNAVINEAEFDIDVNKANIHFISPFGEKISDIKEDRLFDIFLELQHIGEEEFEDFIFGNITLKDLLENYCFKKGINISFNNDIFINADTSWEMYINRIGYTELNIIVPPETTDIRDALQKENAVWCHNKSCSGKTFTAVNILDKMFENKIVYNSCYSLSCSYDFIKLILATGQDCSLLIDDIQYDTEAAAELMNIVSNLIDDLKKRNVYVFFVSWTSLYQNVRFQGFKTKIPVFQTKPELFIKSLKRRVKNQKLLKICSDNIALLSVAAQVAITNKDLDVENILFNTFVLTKETNKLIQIYKLCVLGSYEYEPSISFLGEPKLSSEDMRTVKYYEGIYSAGHRQICAFLVSYIETNKKLCLPKRNDIIYDYIFKADSKIKWKLMKQLIGDNNENELLSISPIWSALHDFEREVSIQTMKDPTWQNTPSSMYFVLSLATLLGVIDDYFNVLHSFCNLFNVVDGKIELKYEIIKTTNDFNNIREKMIEEDYKFQNVIGFERGNELNCNLAHKNWALGFIVGLKEELSKFGYSKIYEAALNDLKESQLEDGFWYPKRVPWITARILIGLCEAGFTYSDAIVKNGVEYLLSILNGSHYWEAHTGGWNNVYETSALCLAAITESKYPYECNSELFNVINYLYENRKEWMIKGKEVDGTTTACLLLKIRGDDDVLIEYITNLCEREVFNKIRKTEELDYSKHQSCDTTQIAFFVVDLCWCIFERELSFLLKEYLTRSQCKKEVICMKKIFISYCDEGNDFVNKLKKIVERLQNEGHEVFFYANAPIGTNNIDFMRNADNCDLIFLMGTKKYKEKVEVNKQGGLRFEDLIFADTFMSIDSSKIVPIAFDSFNESIPKPFNTNKGIRCTSVDRNFLDTLVNEINKK